MTSRADIPIPQIVDMLEERLDRLVFEFWPNAETHGPVIYCNPKPGDLGSFQVFLVTRGKNIGGHWARYSQKRGGNVLNLIAYGLSGETEHKPASYGPAILWAKQWLGLDRPETDAERRRREARFERRRRENAAKAEQAARRASDHVAEIWRGARPIDWDDTDNPVVRYLTGDPVWKGDKNVGNRGFDLGAIEHWCGPKVLRYHPELWHWTAKVTVPAMIAAISSPHGFRSVHCTALDPGGVGKAKIRGNAKLMRGPVEGGFVPITLGETGLTLREAEAAGCVSSLLICEGIETGTALACGISEPRIWAALSIANIAALAPLIARSTAIDRVVLAIENDVKPQAIRDRERVLSALEEAGKPVYSIRSHAGSDFADLY